MYGVEYGPDPNYIEVNPKGLSFTPEGVKNEEVKIMTESEWSFTSVPNFVSAESREQALK